MCQALTNNSFFNVKFGKCGGGGGGGGGKLNKKMNLV